MKIERQMDWHREDEYFDSKGNRWVVSYRLKRKKEFSNCCDKFWIELFQIDNNNTGPKISERYPNNKNEQFNSSAIMYEEGNKIIKDKNLTKKK